MDYKFVAKVVQDLKGKNDYVFINTKDNLGLFEYYYNREHFLSYSKNMDSICRTQNIMGIADVAEISESDFEKGSKVFLIQSYHKLNRSDNPIASFLTKKITKVYSTNEVNGIEFTLFVVK